MYHFPMKKNRVKSIFNFRPSFLLEKNIKTAQLSLLSLLFME